MDDSCEELEAEAEYYANKDSWDMPKYHRAYKPRNKKRIGIVCTENQYKMIKKLASENCTTMSDYILKKLFGKSKTKKHLDWEEEPPIDCYDDNEI